MRIPLGGVLAVAGVLVVPAVAQAQVRRGTATQHPAQHEMKHELGVDLRLGYNSPSGGNGGFVMSTPVDVRAGFVTHGKLSPEIRFAMGLSTGGTTTYNIDPGLNVLYTLSRQSLQRNTYLTGGADVQIIDAGANSGAVPGLNVGLGCRRPYESGAWRLEAYFKYMFKNTSLGVPNTSELGLRVGLSLWH